MAVPRATSNKSNLIFDTTSSGAVLHLHNVLGLPLPPPQVSRYTIPRQRLHTSTLVYHQIQAPNNHPKPIYSVVVLDTNHELPIKIFGFCLVETLDIDDDDSASVCNVMILVCFELTMTLETVLFFFGLASGLFDYPLSVFQFHLATPYENVGGY